MLAIVASVPVALTKGLPLATPQAHGLGGAGYRTLQIPGQLANQGGAAQLCA
jgi:hypothetical protein